MPTHAHPVGSAAPTSHLSRWYPTRRPVAHARMRVFCFPFAGGGASAFNGWSASLPPDVEVCAVQLPGREHRFSEAAIGHLPTLLDALLPAITPLLDRPFVFVGYSMGARVAVELARRLQEQGWPMPMGVVVAAAESPRARRNLNVHLLSDDQLVHELARYDGIPQEVMAERDLLDLMLPMVRADFALVDTPVALNATQLRCPVSAWGGTQDLHVSVESLARWRDESRGEFRLRLFPGGHFFLRSAKAVMLGALHEQCEQWFAEHSRGEVAPAA